MLRFVRTAFSHALVVLLLLGGTEMLPESVLCVGPGNHCHFETVVGASCSQQLPASPGSVPRDGLSPTQQGFPARIRYPSRR
jgi:hypothetical protein